MADFINTIDALGDDVVMDSIIDRTITEFKDDSIEAVGPYAFYNCSALSYVHLPLIKVILTYAAFGSCKALYKVTLPELVKIGYYSFAYSKVYILDLPKTTTLGYNTYEKASITHLLLRADSVCTLDKTSNYTPANIYVPAALIDSYKAATNWSTYADQFRALEDYTVDGTITGDLDETKI